MKFRFYAVKLSVIIGVIFILQTTIQNFTGLFVLNELSWQQPWRFITSIFLHGGIAHLVLNLFALLLFGSILERFINHKKLLLVFFTTGILANIVSINFYNSSLGASGAIFGIIGALILIKPLMPIWAFGMPMPLFVAGILWAIGDLLGTYGFFTSNPINNTGNIAHLSGMAFGILLGFWLRKHLKEKRIKKVDLSLDESQIRNWEEVYMR